MLFKWKVQIWCKFSANLDTFSKKRSTEMTSNPEGRSVNTFKRIGCEKVNLKGEAKYSMLCATYEIILLDFPSSLMVEFWFYNVQYLLIKEISFLNIERDVLRLKFIIQQPLLMISSMPTKRIQSIKR